MTREEFIKCDEYITTYVECIVRSGVRIKEMRRQLNEFFIGLRDELLQLPSPISDAVEFAEWAGKHYETVLYLHKQFRWCTPEVAECGGSEEDYLTTQQLYDIYKQQPISSKEGERGGGL